MLDVTFVPDNIRYLQDGLLLNEAREKLEVIIYHFVNPVVCRCQDDTADVPEKTILYLPKEESIVK